MFEGPLQIRNILDETYDVKSFMLEKKSILFLCGQYMIFSLPDFPEFSEEERPFTFSCSPLRDHLRITIKKFGRVTTVMHEELKAGMSLHARGPFGESLTFDDSIRDDLVLIAGGSGITPFRSMLEYISDKRLKNRVVLLYSNRTEKDIIYRQYLDGLDRRQVTVVHTLTSEKPAGWKGETGYIGKEMILKYVKDLGSRLFYLCGPPAMIKATKTLLTDLEVSEEQIRIEDWMLPGKHEI